MVTFHWIGWKWIFLYIVCCMQYAYLLFCSLSYEMPSFDLFKWMSEWIIIQWNVVCGWNLLFSFSLFCFTSICCYSKRKQWNIPRIEIVWICSNNKIFKFRDLNEAVNAFRQEVTISDHNLRFIFVWQLFTNWILSSKQQNGHSEAINNNNL